MQALETHAISIGIHAGVLALVGIILPVASGAVKEDAPIRMEIVMVQPELAPVVVAPEKPIVSAARPEAVPEQIEQRLVAKAKPFLPTVDPEAGDREAPEDTTALPVQAAAPLEFDMESTVGTGNSDNYVSTTNTIGDIGIRQGADTGRGGTGGGRQPSGAVTAPNSTTVSASADWQITQEPEPTNDRRMEPDYPALAKKEKREAKVVVDLVIDKTGKVAAATLVNGAGHGFDQAALRYARKLRFRPALAGRVPVASRIEWVVEFRAKN